MTKKQRRERKQWIQLRKAQLLRLYYKVKPSSKGWIPIGGLAQNGKYTLETGIPIYDGMPRPTP